jgi:hypothetical protein
MTNTERFRRDLVAAKSCITALGSLTPSVRDGIVQWFPDVDVEEIYPLPEWPLTPQERHRMIGVVVDEMLAAVEKTLADGLIEEEAFEVLAPVVDPLYREFHALHAQEYNARWRDSLPATPDELDLRIAQLEMLTGMSRDEFRHRCNEDRGFHAFLTGFGVTLDDLP